MVSFVNHGLTIGIVAGEASGDLLGANLIRAIQAINPHIKFEGIAGPQMIAAGCQSLFPMEKLSVMGLVEVLKHLPEILNIRRKLLKHFLENPPDLFIGIDAPDFNLSLEQALKKTGISTVHYVSPTVWAWKQWRLKKIAKSVDLMLTLLPFESRFYEEKNIPVQFIGHPFADEISLQIDKASLRKALNLPTDKKIIALLPGSRVNEINYLGELFIQTAEWCLQREPNLLFVAPMVNEARYQQFNQIL